MSGFVRDRGPWLAAVVGIMFAVSVAQTGISYTMAFGGLSGLLPKDRSGMAAILILLRFGLVALMVGLWALRRQRALFRAIIVANALFTLALLVHTSSLIAVLFGRASEAVNTLLLDVVLMAASYILIFSVWYWVIDLPGVKDIPRADEPWHFLFPQRAGGIPGYESWAPRYGDYLYLALTTSFTFSPSETALLTRRAKAIMMLQAVISVVSLTAIAGSAINILAGAK